MLVFGILVAGAMGLVAANQGFAAVALPLVLLVGVAVFMQPVLGLFLLAGTIPLEAALMVEGASAPRLVGIAVFGVWGLQKLLRQEPLGPLLSPGMVQVALAFIAFACFSVLWADYANVLPRQLFLLVQLLLLAVLTFDLASSWERVAWVARFLVMAALIAAVLTAQQYFGLGVRRAGRGVVGGINRTALTLVTVRPFAFYLLRSRSSSFWRAIGLVYIGVAPVAVAATLSRMNFLLFPLVVAIHLLIMARHKGQRRGVLLLALAAAATLSLVPTDVVRDRALTIVPYLTQTIGTEESVQEYSGRGYILRVGLAMLKENPVVGVGYYNFRLQFPTYAWTVPGTDRLELSPRSPHSSHIGLLAELGMVGFILWGVLFAVGFKYLRRAWHAPEGPSSEHALLVQAIAITSGLFVIYGLYAEVHASKLFWLVIGLVVAVDRLAARERARVHDPSDSRWEQEGSKFSSHTP